jgi:hypothetical protein
MDGRDMTTRIVLAKWTSSKHSGQGVNEAEKGWKINQDSAAERWG